MLKRSKSSSKSVEPSLPLRTTTAGSAAGGVPAQLFNDPQAPPLPINPPGSLLASMLGASVGGGGARKKPSSVDGKLQTPPKLVTAAGPSFKPGGSKLTPGQIIAEQHAKDAVIATKSPEVNVDPLMMMAPKRMSDPKHTRSPKKLHPDSGNSLSAELQGYLGTFKPNPNSSPLSPSSNPSSFGRPVSLGSQPPSDVIAPVDGTLIVKVSATPSSRDHPPFQGYGKGNASRVSMRMRQQHLQNRTTMASLSSLTSDGRSQAPSVWDPRHASVYSDWQDVLDEEVDDDDGDANADSGGGAVKHPQDNNTKVTSPEKATTQHQRPKSPVNSGNQTHSQYYAPSIAPSTYDLDSVYSFSESVTNALESRLNLDTCPASMLSPTSLTSPSSKHLHMPSEDAAISPKASRTPPRAEPGKLPLASSFMDQELNTNQVPNSVMTNMPDTTGEHQHHHQMQQPQQQQEGGDVDYPVFVTIPRRRPKKKVSSAKIGSAGASGSSSNNNIGDSAAGNVDIEMYLDVTNQGAMDPAHLSALIDKVRLSFDPRALEAFIGGQMGAPVGRTRVSVVSSAPSDAVVPDENLGEVKHYHKHPGTKYKSVFRRLDGLLESIETGDIFTEETMGADGEETVVVSPRADTDNLSYISMSEIESWKRKATVSQDTTLVPTMEASIELDENDDQLWEDQDDSLPRRKVADFRILDKAIFDVPLDYTPASNDISPDRQTLSNEDLQINFGREDGQRRRGGVLPDVADVMAMIDADGGEEKQTGELSLGSKPRTLRLSVVLVEDTSPTAATPAKKGKTNFLSSIRARLPGKGRIPSPAASLFKLNQTTGQLKPSSSTTPSSVSTVSYANARKGASESTLHTSKTSPNEEDDESDDPFNGIRSPSLSLTRGASSGAIGSK